MTVLTGRTNETGAPASVLRAKLFEWGSLTLMHTVLIAMSLFIDLAPLYRTVLISSAYCCSKVAGLT
jgi:hypothetical protein